MSTITDQARFWLEILAGISAIIVAILATALSSNIAYIFRKILPGEPKQGRHPTKHSPWLWVLFIAFLILGILSAAFAAAAPAPKPLPDTNFTNMYWLMSGEMACRLSFELVNNGDSEDQIRRYYAKAIIRDNEYFLTSDIGPYVYTNAIIGRDINGVDISLFHNKGEDALKTVEDIINLDHAAYFPLYIPPNKSVLFVADVYIPMEPSDYPIYETFPSIQPPPDDPNVSRVYVSFIFESVTGEMIESNPYPCIDIVDPAN